MDMYRQKRFSNEQICHGTNSTVVKVQICPENTTIFKKLSEKKMCDTYPKCLGEPLVYHCVRYNGYFVEVCAPNRLIVGSCCPVFDKGIGLVIEDYKRPCPECPFKYQSANGLQYPTCFLNFTQSTNRKSRTTTPSDDADCTHKSNNCTESSNLQINSRFVIAIAAVVVAMFLLCCLAVILCKRHHFKDLIKKGRITVLRKGHRQKKEETIIETLL